MSPIKGFVNFNKRSLRSAKFFVSFFSLTSLSHTIPIGFGIIYKDLLTGLYIAGGHNEALVAENDVVAVVAQTFYTGKAGRVVRIPGLVLRRVHGIDAKVLPYIKKIMVYCLLRAAPVLGAADQLAAVLNDLAVFTDGPGGE